MRAVSAEDDPRNCGGSAAIGEEDRRQDEVARVDVPRGDQSSDVQHVAHHDRDQAQLGHRSEQSTHVYAHLGSGAQRRLVEALAPLVPPLAPDLTLELSGPGRGAKRCKEREHRTGMLIETVRRIAIGRRDDRSRNPEEELRDELLAQEW